ncbi:unnamed protein product [Closterium sp. NIES-65]|nr:unnamed protein product [Closterium sp. NIES-65]
MNFALLRNTSCISSLCFQASRNHRVAFPGRLPLSRIAYHSPVAFALSLPSPNALSLPSPPRSLSRRLRALSPVAFALSLPSPSLSLPPIAFALSLLSPSRNLPSHPVHFISNRSRPPLPSRRSLLFPSHPVVRFLSPPIPSFASFPLPSRRSLPLSLPFLFHSSANIHSQIVHMCVR